MDRFESEILPFAHGFFGRRGGVSEGLYASLNCGPGSKDNPAHVQENRARVAAAFGVGPERLLSLHQCHSARVVTVDGPFTGARPEADALVTATPGLLLGILTADCAPVLLADREARVIASAHAGWKGAFGGILKETVAAMERLGGVRGRIAAAVGPCIAQDSYRVGPEFVEHFIHQRAANEIFFKDNCFDLKSYVAHQLTCAGIENIDVFPHDTCADEQRFFSYRRATLRGEGDYGRQISSIIMEN